MSIIANMVARLTADTTAFDRNLQNSRKSLYGLTADSAKAQQQLLGLAKSALAFAGAGVGLYGLKRAVTAVMQEAASFEYQMARVHTMLDEGTAQYLPQYAQAIKQMAVEYGEGVESLTAATYDILSASIAPAQAMQVLETNVRAAKGGFTDTATSVKASVGILNAYGMAAEQAGTVTNLMHKIVKRGVITFEELAQNIGTVSSLAAVLGVDLEALGAIIATMTRAGINAEITMTALRAILNVFKTPTDAAIKAAKELGFELDATSIRGGGLIEVMQKLADADAEQLDALMPNIRGLVGFAAALKNATKLADDYRYMQGEVNQQLAAFQIASDTQQTKLNQLSESWKAFKRALGESPILWQLKFTLEQGTEAFDGLRRAIDAVTESVKRGLRELTEYFGTIDEKLGQYHSGIGMTPGFGSALRSGPGPVLNLGDRPARQPSMDEWDQRLEQFWQQQGMGEMGQNPELLGGHGMPPASEGASALDEAAKTTAVTMDIAAAYRAMAADMDRMTQESYDVRMGLLEKERDAYLAAIEQEWTARNEAIDAQLADTTAANELLVQSHAQLTKDKALLDKWYAEQKAKLDIEQQKASDDFFAGFAAGIEELQREMKTLGEIGADVARDLAEGLADAFTEAIVHGKDLGDQLKALGQQIMAMVMKQLMFNVITSVMGAGTAHTGGTVGATSFATRQVSPAMFATAPRLHSGLASDEFPAILQRGERVTSRAMVAAENRRSQEIVGLLQQIAARPSRTKVVIVDDERRLREQLMGEMGEEIVLYHQHRTL